ncbi:hypothetical protein MHYP_G00087140 [Metynnis hypsauchen]
MFMELDGYPNCPSSSLELTDQVGVSTTNPADQHRTGPASLSCDAELSRNRRAAPCSGAVVFGLSCARSRPRHAASSRRWRLVSGLNY